MINSFSYGSDSVDHWSQFTNPPSHPADDFSILHELNLMTERIDSPSSSLAELPALKKRPANLDPSGAALQTLKRPKTELLYALPTSPVSNSQCQSEDDALPASIKSEALPVLPTPTRNQAAARRALRREARRRQLSRRESTAPTETNRSKSDASSAAEVPSIDSAPDKKAARAIRNRAAAMKSRVEAKQKMLKLEMDNERLAKTVDDLTASNKMLTAQIKALTRSLCPGPVSAEQQQEILAATARIQAEAAATAAGNRR